MSRENVEILRDSLTAFNCREIDAAIAPWDPEGEFMPAMAGAVEGTVYRGLAGLRRYFDELFESFAEVRVDEIEFRDLSDRVLVLYRLKVRGGDSDVVIDQPAGAVYEFRDDKIISARSYLSRDEALEAVGLRD